MSGRTPLDWEAARRRLAEMTVQMEASWQPGPQETNRILAARARDLARPATVTAEIAAAAGCLEFIAGEERYALGLEHVVEVVTTTAPTPVPGTPDFIAGLVNLRGQILSVMELARFLGHEARPLLREVRVIVLSARGMTLGIIADSIIGVRRLDPGTLQSNVAGVTNAAESYIAGVTPERVVFLDAARLLASSDILVGHGDDMDGVRGE